MTVAMLTTSANGEPVQATSSTTGTGTVNTAAASTTGNSGNKPQWLYNEQGQLIKKLPNGKEQVMPGTAGGNNTGTATILSETGGVTTISVSLTNTGHAFLPKTPEQFTHDADGNLTSDGRWTYQWDAENRLIGMETTAAAASNGVPRQKLVFQYDHQSRRISKLVSNWTGGSWSEISNLKFVYDGWNLLSELNGTNAVLRTYAWGLDLSGTEQGAGGIGGLLWMTSHLPLATSHFASFDGNGNVAALLNAQTAQVSAEYEYGPFGETIRATGPAAAENVYRFSAKYTDVETGLLYYGYRYLWNGRWLSRDPIEEQGGANLYDFLHNQPASETDYLGQCRVVASGVRYRVRIADLDAHQADNGYSQVLGMLARAVDNSRVYLTYGMRSPAFVSTGPYTVASTKGGLPPGGAVAGHFLYFTDWEIDETDGECFLKASEVMTAGYDNEMNPRVVRQNRMPFPFKSQRRVPLDGCTKTLIFADAPGMGPAFIQNKAPNPKGFTVSVDQTVEVWCRKQNKMVSSLHVNVSIGVDKNGVISSSP